MAKSTIIIACGGTGGHIYPALAVADMIKEQRPDMEIKFVGRTSGMERELVKENGYEMETINISGFKRGEWLSNLQLPFFLAGAIIKAGIIIRKYSPCVAIGTGGFVSCPVVLSASFMRIPTIILEQNTIPGLTTRFLSHFARILILAYEESADLVTKRIEKTVLGNPIRKLHFVDKNKLRREHGLSEDSQVVLVLGGSQGARNLNNSVAAMLDNFLKIPGRDLIWQTGSLDYSRIKELAGENSHVRVFKYIKSIYDCYSMADLVIARAGATTLAEITAFGLPAVLFPYPHSTDNHQGKNAAALEEKGAAVVLQDNTMELGGTIESIIADKVRLARMARNSKSLSKPDAAKNIVKLINERFFK
ncbi:MAG: undecaprenyldiphospho-muramoylpentapeptide beta-N-acetylglucosaminyltransferase [bacterium]